jgi:hypothetical protein
MNVVERMRDEAKAETTPGLPLPERYRQRGGAREAASVALSLHRASGDDEQDDDEQDDGDAAYQSLSGRYSPFS